jgi:RHS repeat-associated protein
VGGLAMATVFADNSYQGISAVAYGYDANGNVITLESLGGNSGNYLAPNIPGTEVAHYVYDPFVGLPEATGNLAYGNPFRFATKYAEGDFYWYNGSIHTCSPDDLDPGLYYCISREYRTDIGRFMSRDPMDEAGGLNLYAACGNDLVNRVDAPGLVAALPIAPNSPSGPSLPDNPNPSPSEPSPTSSTSTPQLSYATVGGAPAAGSCGEFLWTIEWLLNEPSPNGGWIIQHITMNLNITDCSGAPILNPANQTNYWEAFYVSPGSPISNSLDNWGNDTAYIPCSIGSFEMTGDANFYDGLTLPSSFKVTGQPPSVYAPATTQAPFLTGGGQAVVRTLTATWDCCHGTDKTTKVTAQ